MKVIYKKLQALILFKLFGWYINIWEDRLLCHMEQICISFKKALNQFGKILLLQKVQGFKLRQKRPILANIGKIYF